MIPNDDAAVAEAAAAAASPAGRTWQERVMSLKLHQSAYEYAQKLIQNRRCVRDQRGDWTDHKPARSAARKFIETQGLAEYGRWHLGEDDEEAEDSKRRYLFPCGEFNNVHRCAVLVVDARAGQYKCTDIEQAALHLHALLDYPEIAQGVHGQAACSPGLRRRCSRA